MRSGWKVAVALALGGCMSAFMAACVPVEGPGMPGPGGPGGPGPNQCGALDLQYLVGAPDTVLERMRFAGPVRVYGPGDAVTMDYNPNRINFQLDRYRMIARVSCG